MVKWKYGDEVAMPILSNFRCIIIPIKKEVKKMSRPYFETKVVKVKKKEQKEIVKFRGKKYIITRNKLIGKTYLDEYKGKSKGNWVNGENLDKIKFPCFCRWSDNGWVGILIKDWKDDEAVYTIVRIDRQTRKSETYGSFKSLKEFIEAYHIHILKGKVIIYEEEK